MLSSSILPSRPAFPRARLLRNGRAWVAAAVCFITPFFLAAQESEADAALQLLQKSNEAHVALKQFSANMWVQNLRFEKAGAETVSLEATSVLKTDTGLLTLLQARHQRTRNPKNNEFTYESFDRFGFKAHSSSRFSLSEWDPQRMKIAEHSVSAPTYNAKLQKFLSRHGYPQAPFWGHVTAALAAEETPQPLPAGTPCIRGPETIAGHACIRIEERDRTFWLDAETHLLRRIVTEYRKGMGEPVDSFEDAFYDITPAGTADPAGLGFVLKPDFGLEAVGKIPFLTAEKARENLRRTGRVAGTLFSQGESPSESSADSIPALTPEQRSAIVTVEGDVRSGVGFVTETRGNDFLVTDVRLLTDNHWVKVRDWKGSILRFSEAHRINDSTLALLKVATAPGRLPSSGQPIDGRFRHNLLRLVRDKPGAELRSAAGTIDTVYAGYFTLWGTYANVPVGSPLIDPATGMVIGMMTEFPFQLIVNRETVLSPEQRKGQKLPWYGEWLSNDSAWTPLTFVPQH